MPTINAFTTRRKNQEQTNELYESIRPVLEQIHALNQVSAAQYDMYLRQLKKILPREEKSALPAKTIAAFLSDDKDEQYSIARSVTGLGVAARNKRNINGDLRSALPTLKVVDIPHTRHLAELDENGNVICKWDEETAVRAYYLTKED